MISEYDLFFYPYFNNLITQILTMVYNVSWLKLHEILCKLAIQHAELSHRDLYLCYLDHISVQS